MFLKILHSNFHCDHTGCTTSFMATTLCHLKPLNSVRRVGASKLAHRSAEIGRRPTSLERGSPYSHAAALAVPWPGRRSALALVAQSALSAEGSSITTCTHRRAWIGSTEMQCQVIKKPTTKPRSQKQTITRRRRRKPPNWIFSFITGKKTPKFLERKGRRRIRSTQSNRG